MITTKVPQTVIPAKAKPRAGIGMTNTQAFLVVPCHILVKISVNSPAGP
jgi:hypothetical protein